MQAQQEVQSAWHEATKKSKLAESQAVGFEADNFQLLHRLSEVQGQTADLQTKLSQSEARGSHLQEEIDRLKTEASSLAVQRQEQSRAQKVIYITVLHTVHLDFTESCSSDQLHENNASSFGTSYAICLH